MCGITYISIIGTGGANRGEFYTPSSVAQMMARMTLGNPADLESEFFKRCAEARQNDPLIDAFCLACGLTAMAFDKHEELPATARSLFIQHVLADHCTAGRPPHNL